MNDEEQLVSVHTVESVEKKGRNKKETDTLSRVLDLAITEFGYNTVEKSAAFEVMLRRLHAVRMADKQGHWQQAMLLEEVPSEEHPELHEVIVKNLVKFRQLVDSTQQKGGKTTNMSDDE